MRMSKALTTLAVLAGLRIALMIFGGLPLASTVKGDTIKIWPLGDSITRGKQAGAAECPSYRYDLYSMLADAGWDFDFVGTLGGCAYDNDGFNENFPEFADQDHDGWGGYTTADILYGKSSFPGVPAVAPSLNPDMVLIHLGTNDVIQVGYSAQNSVSNIKSIISAVRNVNPNAEFYVAQVIPFPSQATNIAALNAEIALKIPTLDTADSPVKVVDMHTGFNTAWLLDGVHPNRYGEEFMAQQWLAAVPEPATMAIMGIGGLGVLLRRRK